MSTEKLVFVCIIRTIFIHLFCIKFCFKWDWNTCASDYDNIQIVFCAEYLDMVPKAKAGLSGTWCETVKPKARYNRQTCQGLGYHVLVVCIKLNLFYVIHFPSFNSYVLWIGNLVFQGSLTVPSVHCDQSEAVTKDNLISQYPLHQLKVVGSETLWNLCHRTDKTDRSVESFSMQEPKRWWGPLWGPFHTCKEFCCFSG